MNSVHLRVFPDNALSYGSVAVHCHAGLGRTGLVIATYLVYARGFTAMEAVELIRRRR